MGNTDSAIAAALGMPEVWWVEKFDSRVVFDPVFGCRLWQGPKNPLGYGRVSLSLASKNTQVMAHRLAFAREFGMAALPPGKLGSRRDDLILDHKCFNHACVNPHHLRTIPNYMNVYVSRTRRFEAWESPQV